MEPVASLIEQLRDGCRQCGESDDGAIELFDIEGANDLMEDAAERLDAVKKVRDGYASQAKFADIEAAVYFREFVQRIDAALAAT